MTDVLVIVLVSLCGFALIWVGTIWGIGRIGAWHLLADHYRAGGEPTGERLTWQSAVIGGARYKGSLVFVLARDGLYLAPMPLFGFGHAPLLIPWSAVAAATKGSEPAPVRRFPFPFYEARLPAGRREVCLRLPVRLVDSARAQGFI